MTAVSPGGAVPYIVCTTHNCPGAYPLGDLRLRDQPCLQPNYPAGPTGGKFELYLCNQWPADPRPAADQNLDTLGPLGCSYNQGTCISPTDATCPSGTSGHDSETEDLPCQWGHPVPARRILVTAPVRSPARRRFRRRSRRRHDRPPRKRGRQPLRGRERGRGDLVLTARRVSARARRLAVAHSAAASPRTSSPTSTPAPRIGAKKRAATACTFGCIPVTGPKIITGRSRPS